MAKAVYKDNRIECKSDCDYVGSNIRQRYDRLAVVVVVVVGM